MTSLFDAWVATTQHKHPQQYLEEEGLWQTFINDVVPLLWGKQNFQNYIGVNLLQLLKGIGFQTTSYNYMMIEWILTKFHLHPFDELLGTGQNQLPVDGVDDVSTTMKAYYWDTNGKGKQFYLSPEAYLIEPERYYSPWLDPIQFVGILENYASDDDACVTGCGQTLTGGIDYTGVTYTDLSYNEYLALFTKLAFEYQRFDLVHPDPDIDINDQIASDGYIPNWWEHLLYKQPFKYPFKMPDLHWYYNPRKIYKMYANFLNLTLDDVELYKLQRPRDNVPGGALQDSGDRGRY
jgi:hypothetical protein